MKNESYYAKIFARYYDAFMYRLERTILLKKRKRLLSSLEGNILEIGSGTGINFSFYNKKANVYAIEPSSAMMQKAETRISESKGKEQIAASIKTINSGIGNPELEKEIAEGSLDAVVCTLVLCTVPDLKYTINFIQSKLKKEGKLIVLEHIHPKKFPFTAMHNLFNPFWRLFSMGCNLNRKTDIILKESGFVLVEENFFTKALPFYEAVFVLR
jgi:SAM-dependent methyltransferase